MSGPKPLAVPQGWGKAIDEWAAAARAAGRAAATITTRVDHLRRLARAIGGEPWDVTRDALIDWAGNQDWKRETRRCVYASWKDFFDWGVRKGNLSESPAGELPRVRPGEPAPRPAPTLVYETGLAEAETRTRLILRLAALAGLRRSEIAQVHSRDLLEDLTGWSLRVHGKGDKTRIVPLPEDLARAIREAEGYLFPGRDNGHLSARYIGKLATRALPGDWTLHTLRHRFATRAHAGTGDLIAVQQLLGHASVATTQRYIQPGAEALRRAAAAAA